MVQSTTAFFKKLAPMSASPSLEILGIFDILAIFPHFLANRLLVDNIVSRPTDN